jgi:16S rRNA (cytosine967-C5)-methyltransferase
MRITEKLLDAAVVATTDMLKFNQPADGVLSTHFKVDRTGVHDRAFIAETAYAVLRRKRLLERLVGPDATPRQLVLAALTRLQGCNQRQLAEAVSPRELDWLVQFKAQPEPQLTLAEQADLPDWLTERLLTRMSAEELLVLARGLNQPAQLDLRVNAMKGNREEVLARLKVDGIEGEVCRYAPMGIRLKGRPSLAKHPFYLKGVMEVQDEGSQLLGHLLAPKRGEMVVDFCAGAGGKTLALGAMMRSTGRLYAFDVADKRLVKMKPRVARSGLSNVHPVLISGENDTKVKRLAGKIDRVLVDAPCSGLGTLRRNPDLKWRQTPESVAELTRKQAAILAGAARLVKVGGRIVYATCSILPEENEMIVNAFLAAHPDFTQLSAADVLAKQGITIEVGTELRLLPHTHGTDGFFAAVLERTQ